MPVQTKNINAQPGQDDFTFTSNSEGYMIEDGVSLMAEAGTGVDTSYSNDRISNFGSIYANYQSGIYISGSSETVVNQSSGTITGSIGIYAYDATSDVTINYGQIIGTDGEGIVDANGHSFVNNHGYISGEAGVNSGADEIILNAGTMSGSWYGVMSATGANGEVTSIANTGTISGDYGSIQSSGDGKLSLKNSGTLDGDVSLADGTDDIRNSGAIDGNVQLGNGANLFNGRGGTVSGTIFGGTGDDTLMAGNGAETLDGGQGLNTLYGGDGPDTFVFSALGAEDRDAICDFNVADDKIALDHAVFTMLTVGVTPSFSIGDHAANATDYLFYNASTGGLFYDPYGGGPGKADLIGVLATGLKLTASNFTVD